MKREWRVAREQWLSFGEGLETLAERSLETLAERALATHHSQLATFRWFGQGLLTRPSLRPTVSQSPTVGASPGDPRRTKQIRNESSRDQRAVKTNFAACQPRLGHPREPGGNAEKGVNAGFAPSWLTRYFTLHASRVKCGF